MLNVKRTLRAVVDFLIFAFGVALVVSFAHDAFTLRTWPIRVLSGVIALAIAYRLTRAGLGMFQRRSARAASA